MITERMISIMAEAGLARWIVGKQELTEAPNGMQSRQLVKNAVRSLAFTEPKRGRRHPMLAGG